MFGKKETNLWTILHFSTYPSTYVHVDFLKKISKHISSIIANLVFSLYLAKVQLWNEVSARTLFSHFIYCSHNDIQYRLRLRKVHWQPPAMFGNKLKLGFECDNLAKKLLTSQVSLVWYCSRLEIKIKPDNDIRFWLMWHALVCFQWQRGDKSSVFVLYRWIIALFFTFSFVNSVVFSINRDEFQVMFIYMSRWNLFFTMIYTVLGAILVTQYNLAKKRISEYPNNGFLKFYWMLWNHSICFAIVISVIYWTLLFKHENHSGLNNYLVHATNSIVLIIDLLIIRHPHRVLHFLYPMACGSFYMIFTLVYTLLGGTDRNRYNFVYPVLNWINQPTKATIVGVGCVVFLGVSHLMVHVIGLVRRKVHQIVVCENEKYKLPVVNCNDIDL